MTVLVTGATGFTGGALALRLLDMGERVRVLVRDRNRVQLPSAGNLEILEGDIVDEEAVDAAVDGVDCVYHVAAVYRVSGLPDHVYWDVHVRGTENLIKSALHHRVKRFVHCSTGGVHGHIAEPPANEAYRFQPGDIYQQTKLEGELTARRYFEEQGLPLVIIRPAPIYGPGDLRLRKLFKIASSRVSILLGPGEVYYHMVFIDDLINAFLLASQSEDALGEAFIIAGDEALTLNGLVGLMAEVLGRKAHILHLPVAPFRFAGAVCEGICIPLGINPPIYRRRVDFFTKSRWFDINKAREILKYSPQTDLKRGIEVTAKWYAERGLL